MHEQSQPIQEEQEQAPDRLPEEEPERDERSTQEGDVEEEIPDG